MSKRKQRVSERSYSLISDKEKVRIALAALETVGIGHEVIAADEVATVKQFIARWQIAIFEALDNLDTKQPDSEQE